MERPHKNKDTCKIQCKSKVSLFFSHWPQPFVNDVPLWFYKYITLISTCYRPYLKYSSLQIAVFLGLILPTYRISVGTSNSQNWVRGLEYAIVKLKATKLHSNFLAFFLLMVCLNQLNIIPVKLVCSLRLFFILFGRLQYFLRSPTKFGLMFVKETTQQRWFFYMNKINEREAMF